MLYILEDSQVWQKLYKDSIVGRHVHHNSKSGLEKHLPNCKRKPYRMKILENATEGIMNILNLET